MESVVQLWSDWEIQLLMLLSFTLQMLLFFTGGLRRYSTNMLLRFYLWIAYLGADMVALYALGYLSRHQNVTIGGGTLREVHPLFFLWAPFLLMHLGGQDTITAFAIEDNNLWLRHLLNLGVQVVLTLYVFWKSMDHHNLYILIPSIFVFVTGIIKYGGRTLALMHGDLKNIHGSIRSEDLENICDSILPKLDEDGVDYFGLRQAFENSFPDIPCTRWNRIIGNCFHYLPSKRQHKRYSGSDVAVTYILFSGGFLLEVCAVFTSLMSPWTWAWSKAKKCNGVNHISEFLFSSNVGWPKERPLWSNSMGEYNFLSYLGCEESRLSKLAKKVIRKMGSLVGAVEEPGKSFWMSKLLDTKYVTVDKEIMQCVVHLIYNYSSHGPESTNEQQWQNLGPLKELLANSGRSFGYDIMCFHIFTEAHLCRYFPCEGTTSMELISVCRRLSNYMFYLLVRHPEMLPTSGTTEPILKFFLGHISDRNGHDKYKTLRSARDRMKIV
uniref:DUF4220 domain-containing protein n=1 Tax=Oryza punctata TaxID=4537 RepID=A0A0E0MA93_ORYPU